MPESFTSNENDTKPETALPPPLPPQPPAAPPSAQPSAAPARSKRNPIVALCLSLCPGLGQFYNGQLVKALLFFFGWAAAIALTAEEGAPFGIFIPFIYLVNLVDAYRSAVYLGDRPAQGLEFDVQPESPAWGIGLVVLGGILLLNNLNLLPHHFFRRFWPLLIIALGAVFVWNALRRRQDG